MQTLNSVSIKIQQRYKQKAGLCEHKAPVGEVI